MICSINESKNHASQERRKEERLQTYLSTELIPLENNKTISGKVLNISNSGACLLTNCFLPKDNNYFLSIDTKGYDYIKNSTLNQKINFNIVWQETPSEKGYSYRYGINFKEDSKNLVLPLIQDLHKEREILANRSWQVSHPKITSPSVPLDHPLLESLRPSALAVDVTNLCNLRCKHCFWDYSHKQIPSCTDKNIIFYVKNILDKYPSITNITWYGGEPLINKETIGILEKAISFKKNNLIITNGTFPIPNWLGNVQFGVSIDGIESIHNYLRGGSFYNILKNNVITATKKGIKIYGLYCINALNITCIENFLEEWDNSGIAGIFFTSYTPFIGKPSNLELKDIQRENISNVLLNLKQKYNNLVINSELMLELIKPKHDKELAANCPMNIFNKKQEVICFHVCNNGKIRIPCSYGKDAMHLKCRSVTKIGVYASKILKDKKSLRAMFKAYQPRYSNNSLNKVGGKNLC